MFTDLLFRARSGPGGALARPALFLTALLLLGGLTASLSGASLQGELRKWHILTLGFDGPATNEEASPNPFLDYRLDVTFTHTLSGEILVVPGYYAADGNAAETSATGGSRWEVRFAPPLEGEWSWTASFRQGSGVAVAEDPTAGTAAFFDGESGSFTVGPTDKAYPDMRSRGLLLDVGLRYRRFSETGEFFIKGGSNSPENFLAYYEFDNTQDYGGTANDLDYASNGLHRYNAHAIDALADDPTWQGGKGRNILGAINYLSAQGINSLYAITMNVNGDGREVFPWTTYNSDRTRYDVSKLEQWEIVFEHLQERGILLHVLLQERENDKLLDGGGLGTERRLYYREMIARFGHHLALVWNLGEETTRTTAQHKADSDYFKAHDPFRHQVVLHTWPNSYSEIYTPMLGHESFDGPSLQMGNVSQTHDETLNWLQQSKAAGRIWRVACDEQGPAGTGVRTDADSDHRTIRCEVLWGNLMAGGEGVEYYFGYNYPHNDLDCEDWRVRENLWAQNRHALDFFREHLPFPSMENANSLLGGTGGWVLAEAGKTYAAYLRTNSGAATLDLSGANGTFRVEWYDPRNGGELLDGSVETVNGGGEGSLGSPPEEAGLDWVVRVQSVPKVLFVRGGLGTAGFIVPQYGDDHLADINDTSEVANNHGWGSFADALRDEGFVVEQVTEGTGGGEGSPVDLASLDLAAYDVIVLGSNNAVYPASAVDATESWVLAGGGLLTISDADFGDDWPDASNSDQQFLDRFGLIMNQDHGTYSLQRADGDFDGGAPDHPLLAGVDAFDGEGVTPMTIGSLPAGVTAEVVVPIPPNEDLRRNDSTSGPGSLEFPQPTDGAIVAAFAGAGRVAGFFDRNTFFNVNGKGSDITRFDNGQLARNLINWLANREGDGPVDPPANENLHFALINAATNEVIEGFEDMGSNAVFSLSDLPSSSLNIQAVPVGIVAGSVRFAFDGNPNYRTESVQPFALEGDTSGNYNAWTPSTGKHTLSATAYSEANGQGEVLGSASLTFYVNMNPFTAWQDIHWPGESDVQIIGELVTGSDDTRSNLLEYAFDSDPKLPENLPVPQLTALPGGNLQVEFTLVEWSTDLTYRLQSTSDFSEWTDHVVYTPNGLGFDRNDLTGRTTLQSTDLGRVHEIRETFTPHAGDGSEFWILEVERNADGS